ncbi:MAG TPA: hypothetical protein VI306_21490 [Pyrinomonadaceae bacterium]
MAASNDPNKSNPAIKAAWIGFAGAILAAMIGAAVVWRHSPVPPPISEQSHICIDVEQWSEQGSQPIKGATVELEINSYRYTSTSEDTGCASFEFPRSLLGQRGTIKVTTPEGRTKRITQDVRGPSATIIFYPNN